MATANRDPIGPMISDFAAMVARDERDPKSLGDALMVGVALSFLLDKTDNELRLAVMESKAPYDAAEELEVEALYRAWLAPATTMLARVAASEECGHAIRYAEQFRRCVAEAAAALGDDTEFFGSDESAALRDAAIDAHREGRTVSFHELGA